MGKSGVPLVRETPFDFNFFSNTGTAMNKHSFESFDLIPSFKKVTPEVMTDYYKRNHNSMPAQWSILFKTPWVSFLHWQPWAVMGKISSPKEHPIRHIKFNFVAVYRPGLNTPLDNWFWKPQMKLISSYVDRCNYPKINKMYLCLGRGSLIRIIQLKGQNLRSNFLFKKRSHSINHLTHTTLF